MKSLVLFFAICLFESFALPSTFAVAEKCGTACQRNKNCACASTESPIKVEETPQLVTLTFDDSVTSFAYESYYEKLLFQRKNPDGKPITASFYVPHQYTDYEKVNNLYNKGFDIGVNSISKGDVDYWKSASLQDVVDELDGQRKIISKFANIPIDDIRGSRIPHFEVVGDTTFDAYTRSGITYDSSWVSLSTSALFPFTLDYKVDYPSQVGSAPTQSHPNIWINPIINLRSQDNNECNVLFSCQVKGNAAEIKNWLIAQYERVYKSNRAPLSLLITSSWFQTVEDSFEGLTQFLDYLKDKRDTFLVSHKEVMEWSKNPKTTANYKTSHSIKSSACKVAVCPLQFGEFEVRFMRSCVVCPNKYPWLKNPEGN